MEALTRQGLVWLTTMTPDTPTPGSRSRTFFLICIFHFSCKGSQGCQKHRWIGGFVADNPVLGVATVVIAPIPIWLSGLSGLSETHVWP
jgi:hypothetical protein